MCNFLSLKILSPMNEILLIFDFDPKSMLYVIIILLSLRYLKKLLLLKSKTLESLKLI